MNKNELERIALETLERIERETLERHQTQDEKIRRIENRVEDFERQLTRLSTSLQSLRPLIDGLNSIVPSGGKR